MESFDDLLKDRTIDGIEVKVPDGLEIVRLQISMQELDGIEDKAERAYILAGKAVGLCTHYADGAALQVAAIRGISDEMVQACLNRCGLRMNVGGEVEELPVDPSTQQQQQE